MAIKKRKQLTMEQIYEKALNKGCLGVMPNSAFMQNSGVNSYPRRKPKSRGK